MKAAIIIRPIVQALNTKATEENSEVTVQVSDFNTRDVIIFHRLFSTTTGNDHYIFSTSCLRTDFTMCILFSLMTQFILFQNFVLVHKDLCHFMLSPHYILTCTITKFHYSSKFNTYAKL